MVLYRIPDQGSTSLMQGYIYNPVVGTLLWNFLPSFPLQTVKVLVTRASLVYFLTVDLNISFMVGKYICIFWVTLPLAHSVVYYGFSSWAQYWLFN